MNNKPNDAGADRDAHDRWTNDSPFVIVEWDSIHEGGKLPDHLLRQFKMRPDDGPFIPTRLVCFGGEPSEWPGDAAEAAQS